MKKYLLLAGAALMAFGTLSAKTEFYPADTETMGVVNKVSKNGRYAIVNDDEANRNYLWDAQNPGEYTYIGSRSFRKVNAYGITDDCTMVGSAYKEGGKWRPVVRKGLDGDWEELTVNEAALNTAEAVAISNDGKYIAGYEMVQGGKIEEEMIKGAYYPCMWTRNDDGEYEYTSYFGIDIPNQQGFITTCLSEDGRVIGGYVHAGCSDGYLPAMMLDGKFVMFDTVEERMEPWYYNGELKGYNLVSYIDGYKDTEALYTFAGGFFSIDEAGNLYGCRTTAEKVKEDGSGILYYHAAVYNIEEEKWYYYDDVLNDAMTARFSCGKDRELMFCAAAKMYQKGEVSDITTTLHFAKEFEPTVTGITHMSDDTRTLGGMYEIMNPATGMPQYYPFMLVLDKDALDYSGIEIAKAEDSTIAIVLSRGRIDVCGAENVVVYDLNGRVAGQGSSVSVNAGTYVVKADSVSRTVIVK